MGSLHHQDTTGTSHSHWSPGTELQEAGNYRGWVAVQRLRIYHSIHIRDVFDSFRDLLQHIPLSHLLLSLLVQFPGPLMAKVSNLYLTRRSVARFQLYKEIQNLYRTYGDIVRVGK